MVVTTSTGVSDGICSVRIFYTRWSVLLVHTLIFKCDWIGDNPASTHNYKYLETPNLNIITQKGKQMLA